MARIPPPPTPRVTKTLSQDNSPLSSRPRRQFEQAFKLHGWVQTARPAPIKLLSYPQDVLPFVGIKSSNPLHQDDKSASASTIPITVMFPCHSLALLTQEPRLNIQLRISSSKVQRLSTGNVHV